MPLNRNPHQTVTCFGCVGVSMYASWFFVPKMRQFCMKRWFFLPKSASSVSRSQAHLAQRKRIGWSIGFNFWTSWTLCDVIFVNICLNDVSEMFNCWERRWIDFDCASRKLSATAPIFSDVRTAFGFSAFRLSMKMPVYFTFFTRWRTYAPDGASLLSKSVRTVKAIFSSVVYAYSYTQPYSFSGRIKLIICQFRHERSGTIHEISTS